MYLGFNCNQHTFSVSVLASTSGEIIYFDQVHFDEDLPHRETSGGVVQGTHAGECAIDPQMLVEAMEILLENLLDSTEVNIADITHITGSASASTIFTNESFSSTIDNTNPSLSLITQIRSIYSTNLSPTQADTSAFQYAEKLQSDYLEATGNSARSVTGAPVTSSTRAAQIYKFSRQAKNTWQDTHHIHTTSSFLLSLLIGHRAPLNLTDTSQLGLFNIHTKTWQKDLSDLTSPETWDKLPEVTDSESFVSNISSYFQSKYGFSADTKCLSWLSQDAAHAIGMNLLNLGSSNLSLDDSYTFSIVTKTIPTDIPTLARVTLHPIAGYISHMVLENGLPSFKTILDSLKIEPEEIDSHLQNIPSSSLSLPVLPFVKKEKKLSIPAVKQHNASLLSFTRGQILHIKLYSQWLDQSPVRIYISGRAAKIKGIKQICANIFQVDCIHISEDQAITKGLSIHCDIEQDLSRKTIFSKYHRSAIVDKTDPEPYMTNIYTNQLKHYHQLLYNHINKKETTSIL